MDLDLDLDLIIFKRMDLDLNFFGRVDLDLKVRPDLDLKLPRFARLCTCPKRNAFDMFYRVAHKITTTASTATKLHMFFVDMMGV